MNYVITKDYIDIGNARSGEKLKKVKFLVSHDTGNPGSTAYGNRHYFNMYQPSASAHTFIDDQYILEIIPLDEKAWHVRYDVKIDNKIFGDDANDIAIGIELAWGGTINFHEAYQRYVWYHAHLVEKYHLDPSKDIVPHSQLDPERRTDPGNALNRYGISWGEFINDVQDLLHNPKSNETKKVRGVSASLPIKKGNTGQFVKEIQQDLIKASFNLPIYGADGVFGEETENAVMRFQKKYGLHIDGLVGTHTIEKLKDVLRTDKAIHTFPLPNGTLSRGDEGEKVKQLQRALNHLHFDPKQIDGIYGTFTEDAVRRFQSMYRELKDDGIYGPKTRKYLRMELAGR